MCYAGVCTDEARYSVFVDTRNGNRNEEQSYLRGKMKGRSPIGRFNGTQPVLSVYTGHGTCARQELLTFT